MRTDLMEFRCAENMLGQQRCAFNPKHITDWVQYEKYINVFTRDYENGNRNYALHLDELSRLRELTVAPENRVPEPQRFLVFLVWDDATQGFADVPDDQDAGLNILEMWALLRDMLTQELNPES